MKKYITIGIIGLIWLNFIVGCGGGSNPVPVYTPTPIVINSPTPTQIPTPSPTKTASPTPTTVPTPTPDISGSGNTWVDPAGWNLVFVDNFDGPNINADNWGFETGGGGWGNNELQYYTNRTQNAFIFQGKLIIAALAESYNGCDYTSAKLTTQGKKSWKYGKIVARIKFPYGQGIWPKFWMYGTTGSWPACGSIDIGFMFGGIKDDTVYSWYHWDNGGYSNYGQTTQLPDPAILHDDYHYFELEWDAGFLRSRLDGGQFVEMDITPAYLSEFHQNFFMIFNLAVGGNFGNPDGTTVFPQYLVIDWVKVYQRP